MNQIRILPEHLANKIAAGEVVQRPASVAKELIENSLDAHATNILIEIENGGIDLIRIVDNGAGMSEHDALLSVQRHATSKIAAVDDLERITTYGFRGEALPSILAVSRLLLKTRRAGEETGYFLRSDGGNGIQTGREARDPGTTVTVRNLFFNVPARRKFLRGRATEFRHLYDVIQRFALSRPDIGMTFISDGETILELSPADHDERIVAVLGERQLGAMLDVETDEGPVTLSGYIGKPSFGQKLRGKQFLFLNRRAITNRSITHAIFSGYENLILKNSYPSYLLFLEMDPSSVDVNVHPAKSEVKFENEQAVYHFVQSAVRKTLSTSDVPALSIRQPSAHLTTELHFSDRQHSWGGPTHLLDGIVAADALFGSAGHRAPQEEREMQRQTPESPPGLTTDGPLVQVHRKYILLQIEGGLMIVDQHVAHERILYEKILGRMTEGKRPSQQLLFPVTFDLTAGDASLLKETIPRMDELGFSLKEFSGNSFVIEATPPEVPEGQEVEVIEDFVRTIKENPNSKGVEVQDLLAKSFSCRSAVKAGTGLSETEMRTLVRELFQTATPFVCPHGRPTVMRISVDELDRRFGRT